MSLSLFSQECCEFIGFSHPEEYPKPAMSRIMDFVRENIIYPETAIKDKEEGRVFIQFCIGADGITREHKIVRGVREDLDNEALRVAKLIKFDEPAKNQGKPVELCFAIPVTFSLSKKVKSSRQLKQRRRW